MYQRITMDTNHIYRQHELREITHFSALRAPIRIWRCVDAWSLIERKSLYSCSHQATITNMTSNEHEIVKKSQLTKSVLNIIKKYRIKQIDIINKIAAQ